MHALGNGRVWRVYGAGAALCDLLPFMNRMLDLMPSGSSCYRGIRHNRNEIEAQPLRGLAPVSDHRPSQRGHQDDAQYAQCTE